MTVTTPYRELHRFKRSLSQALIDGLGPIAARIMSAERNTTLGQNGRAVVVYPNGRILVYDATGKVESEHHDPR